MTKQLTTLIGILLLPVLLFAQNVGIGTTSPLFDFHLQKVNRPRLMIETTGSGVGAELQLKSTYSNSAFRLNGLGEAGTELGVPKSGLTVLDGQAGLAVGTSWAFPLHFATNNVRRVTVDPSGVVLVNPPESFTPAPNDPSLIARGTTGAAAKFVTGSAGKKSAVVLDGFLTVTGSNPTAFVHKTTLANTTGNVTKILYGLPISRSDIVLVTPNWNPSRK